MTLAAGTRLGPYEILAPIGAGGMGQVYSARDTRLDRAVAVKILPAEFASDQRLKVRFEREARTISQLSHPNICTLYDVGENYIVMELLEGESLADRLSRGAMPLADVLKYGVQIAEALGKAHRERVIHRDLKPGNIMITKSGAKLLDFGLAKTGVGPAIGAASETGTATQQKPLTAEGVVLGTVQYMAPEQLAGDEPDARTDIFALGAVLYEMATGKRAFEGKTKTSVIAAIVSGEPRPIAELQPLTPPALEHVVQKCLAKDPESRWQNAMDIAEELRWISQSGSQASMPMVRRKRRERMWMAIAAAALIAAAVLAAVLWRGQDTTRSITAAILPPPGTSFQWDQDIASLTFSPNGKLMTFEAKPNDGRRVLWIRRLDSGEARPLSGAEVTDQPLIPFWSPDGKWIAFFSDGKLKKMAIEGGPAIALADAAQGRGGSWNNDGEIIFAPSHRGGISEVSANGGPVRVLTRLEEARGETSHRWPVFLPDGKRFLFVCGGAGPHRDLTGIYSGSLESPGRRLILSSATNFALIPGHLLFTRENYLMAQRLNSSTLELVGEPVRIAENVAGNGPFLFSAFAASQNGTIMYLTDLPNEAVLRWLDRNGKESGSLGSSADYQTLRFSRDGKRLAVTMRAHAPDIWIYDLDRGVRTRFTSNPASDRDPVWSPDGKQIAFSSDRASFGDLYVKSSDGLTLERLLGKFDNAIDVDDWSPDGRMISVHVPNNKSQRGEIWLVPTDGTQKPYPFIATEFSAYGGHFSPNMRWFTFISNETGRNELYAIPFPGGGERRQLSTAGALGHHWTRNGKEIVYGALPGVAMSIAVDGGKFSDPRFLFKLPPTVLGLDTVDGQRFLAIDVTTSEPVLVLTTNWTRLLDRNSEH